MILRKPYAFLAKHFKKIHFILSILVVYLMYRTNLIFQFFNEYVSTQQNLIGQELTSNLFNIFLFLIPFLWILLSIIILSLMVAKKKPFTFYVVNIIVAIVVLVFYTYTNNLITTMEIRLIDIRTIRAIRDISMFVFLAQSIVSCMIIVRATGFDVKKFNFGEDLAQLDVKEEDREEFEVNLELDTDKTKRDLRRNLRYAKYVYVENKYLIHLVASIVIVITSFVIFMNVAVYHKTYKESNFFTIDGLNMKIENAYIIQTDYNGNPMTGEGKSLVVLDLNVRKVTSNEKIIEKAAATLVIGKTKYYHTEKYRDKIIDLGKTYELEEIKSDASNYLLVYEIPTSYINKKMTFEYYDKETFSVGVELQSVSVKITPINLEENKKTVSLEQNTEITLTDSILKDSTLLIKNIEIASTFINQYPYCPKTDECYNSIEYIKPSITNTYDKTLLKVTGAFTQNENSHIQSAYDLYDFINLLGHIEYTINGQKKIQTISFKEAVPVHNRKKEECYIEVLKEVEQAEQVTLVLQIRNVTYQYQVK